MTQLTQINNHYRKNYWNYRLFYHPAGYLHLPLAADNGHGEYQQQLIPIIKFLVRQPQACCLELGSGMGANLKHLQKLFPLASFTGIDLSYLPKSKTISFIKDDFTHSDFIAKFDLIFAIESFSHLKDPATCLEKYLRLLKPQGELIIFDYFWPRLTAAENSEQKIILRQMMNLNDQSLQLYERDTKATITLNQRVVKSKHNRAKLAAARLLTGSKANSLLPGSLRLNVEAYLKLMEFLNSGEINYLQLMYLR